MLTKEILVEYRKVWLVSVLATMALKIKTNILPNRDLLPLPKIWITVMLATHTLLPPKFLCSHP